MTDEELLWHAFLAGFRESGEGFNGEVSYTSSAKPTERRLKSRFNALREAGKIRNLTPAISDENIPLIGEGSSHISLTGRNGEYRLIEESLNVAHIDDHEVILQKAVYPDKPELRKHQWHAFCTSYFGEGVPTEERVLARNTSFYGAVADAIDAYGNSREHTSG